MYFNLWIVVLLALALYFVLPIMVFVFVKSERIKRVIANVLFGIYLVLLIIGVWTKVSITANTIGISLDFTYTTTKTINWGFSHLKVSDMLINLAMLIPVGIMISINYNNSFLKTIILGAVIGLVCGVIIEFGQFALPIKRSPQLTDVIFNTISVFLGVLFGELLKKFKQGAGKTVC